MEFKGTKGKWKIGIAFQGETPNIKIKTNGQLLVVEDVDGKAVALLGRILEVEQESNAKLIEAAPEMFEMLKMVKYELTSCIKKLSKHGYEVDFQTPFEIEQLLTKITQ
jgi:hypothetical protein